MEVDVTVEYWMRLCTNHSEELSKNYSHIIKRHIYRCFSNVFIILRCSLVCTVSSIPVRVLECKQFRFSVMLRLIIDFIHCCLMVDNRQCKLNHLSQVKFRFIWNFQRLHDTHDTFLQVSTIWQQCLQTALKLSFSKLITQISINSPCKCRKLNNLQMVSKYVIHRTLAIVQFMGN